MEQVWRFVPHCCNALAVTATHYDTLDERTLQRWVARTVSTVAASRGLVRQHDLAATIGVARTAAAGGVVRSY